ncbi:MAG TPA: ATP-binding cassette domain-containing protein [candidate division Zixibacteria bacterium]|nr:ATP-binding cassette domain-containing protein [candidate division Zixibacteria bacterium]
MDKPILNISHVSRNVGDIKILSDISVSFYQNKIYAILGPSGSGKSSLLRLLNRLDDPGSGEIIYNGKNINSYPVCELRKKIGYLFQTPYLFEKTLKDNFLFVDKEISDDQIAALLEKVHLPQKMLDSSVEKLSVGEKQRVAFARLLLTKPEILLLDEPTSALDPSITESLEKFIQEITLKENLTTIIVTHNPEQAIRFGQQGILLSGGKIAESGDIKSLLESPQSDAGKRYKARELS